MHKVNNKDIRVLLIFSSVYTVDSEHVFIGWKNPEELNVLILPSTILMYTNLNIISNRAFTINAGAVITLIEQFIDFYCHSYVGIRKILLHSIKYFTESIVAVPFQTPVHTSRFTIFKYK